MEETTHHTKEEITEAREKVKNIKNGIVTEVVAEKELTNRQKESRLKQKKVREAKKEKAMQKENDTISQIKIENQSFEE